MTSCSSLNMCKNVKGRGHFKGKYGTKILKEILQK
jgi:hypothetical protein